MYGGEVPVVKRFYAYCLYGVSRSGQKRGRYRLYTLPAPHLLQILGREDVTPPLILQNKTKVSYQTKSLRRLQPQAAFLSTNRF